MKRLKKIPAIDGEMKVATQKNPQKKGLIEVWTADGLELWSSARALIRPTVLRANPAYI